MIQDGGETRYTPSSQRADGTRRNPIHSDIVGTQIAGEIADASFQGGLSDTHDIVAGDRPLAAEIGQCQDRASVLGKKGEGGPR